MRRMVMALAILGLFLSVAACTEERNGDPNAVVTDGMTPMQERIAELKTIKEAATLRIKVSHILVKADLDKSGTPSEEELKIAEDKAAKIYDRVMAGEDFDKLATELSDDGDPGQPKNSYAMWDKVEPQNGEGKRSGMVAAFGDVGWKLQVGEVGIAPYDKDKSPYGWHIIKRIE